MERRGTIAVNMKKGPFLGLLAGNPVFECDASGKDDASVAVFPDEGSAREELELVMSAKVFSELSFVTVRLLRGTTDYTLADWRATQKEATEQSAYQHKDAVA